MLKAFERIMYYDSDLKATLGAEVRHYGIFDVSFHDGIVSSIANEDPIGWWYESIDDLVKNNPNVVVDKNIPNYQNTLIEIHNRRQKTLTNE